MLPEGHAPSSSVFYCDAARSPKCVCKCLVASTLLIGQAFLPRALSEIPKSSSVCPAARWYSAQEES